MNGSAVLLILLFSSKWTAGTRKQPDELKSGLHGGLYVQTANVRARG